MTQSKNQNIIYLDTNNFMVVQCLNFFLQVDSNGQILKSLTSLSILAIVEKDVLRNQS